MENLLDVPALEGINSPQGKICNYILVDEQVLGDDSALVQAVVDFVNAILDDAKLVPDEYPVEAMWSYYADYYLAQVNNGGHGQFAHNSEMKPRSLRDCRLGLHAMNAQEYLTIYDAFLTIMAAKDERAQAICDASGFGDNDAEISELNSRFYALNGTMTQLNAAWLRGLPCLKALPASDIAAELEKLADCNPMRQARLAAAAEARRKFEQEDPTYSAAHACAAQEGVTFLHLTSGIPIGDSNIRWGVNSSAGFRLLTVITGSHAEWRDDKGALKGLYFYDTKTRYPSGLGDGVVRASIMGRDNLPTLQDLSAQTKFFYMPLVNLTFAATNQGDGKAVTALIVWVRDANSLQRLPRAACDLFAVGQEHEQFRLIVAYLLWDMSIRVIMRANPSALVDNHTRATMMAAAGAISAAAATAVRLPRAAQIDALHHESEPDFKREQQNVSWQLREIREWWAAQLARIADAGHESKITHRLLFRPSSFKRAADLIFTENTPTPGTDLARRLAFFDDEYGCDAHLSDRVDNTIRTTLTMLSRKMKYNSLIAAARRFELIESDAKAAFTLDPAYFLAEPKQIQSVSKSPLIGVLAVFDPTKPDSSSSTIGLEFDLQGSRKLVEK
jgi:hypothetical protein